MHQRPTKAIFLGAGLGTRMRPLTDDRPKPLIEVNGRPLIDYAIERLVSVGIETIVVNVHYLPDMIEDYLRGRKDAEFIISDERDVLLDTGGAVTKAMPYLAGAPFITHNCDTLWRDDSTNNLAAMIDAFDPDQMDALLLLADRKTCIGFDGKGDFFRDDEGRLTRRGDAPSTPYVWNGVQIVHPRLFDHPPAGPYSTNLMWDRAIERGTMFGLELRGRWMHVGSPDAVEESARFLASAGYM